MAYSLENTADLVALGNAIRSKSGATGNMSVAQMATAVSNIQTGEVDVSSLKRIDMNFDVGVKTAAVGDYAFKKLVDEFTVNNLSINVNFSNVFNPATQPYAVNSMCKDLPNQVLPPIKMQVKDIDGSGLDWSNGQTTYIPIGLSNFADNMPNLTAVPIITKDLTETIGNVNKIFIRDLQYGFNGCTALKNAVMSNMFTIDEWTTAFKYNLSAMFYNCQWLNIIDFTGVCPYINNANVGPSRATADSIYNMFAWGTNCINKIIALPVDKYTITSDKNYFYRFCGFGSTDGKAPLMESFTFATDNGNPIVAPWSGQIINMTEWGYGSCPDTTRMFKWKEITDDTTYADYKNDPDRWTQNYEYSLFDRAALAALIETLPDTSATSDPANPTNQLVLKAGAGSKTDAGRVDGISLPLANEAKARGWALVFNS